MLENYQIPYVHTRHPNAYRAVEVAEAEHLPAYMLAKTVIVRSQNGYAMAVLPADCKIDLEQLAATLNLRYVALATEEEVRELFRDSEIGAMPPFGALFDIPVYLDVRLAEEPYVLFNAGTHRDAIHISVADYLRVADPAIIQFAYTEPRLPLTEAMTRR
jgi:Ala-tRNA(Pro) deacylase